MRATQPRVSAIVINWNGAGDLRIALPSLRQQTYRNMEVVVVDNGSTDDSEIATRDAGATWLPLRRNAGFGPALNIGAKAAGGEVLLLLNNDMRFDVRFVETMVTEMARDSSVFAVDALQRSWDDTQIVHNATFISTWRSAANSDELVPGLYFEQHSVPAPCQTVMASGANLMVRRSMFDALGGLDERMPIGFEDFDICWRAWLRGWKTVFTPHALCWHKVSASAASPKGRRARFAGALAGRLLFATKLLPARYAAAAWTASAAGFASDIRDRASRFPAERARALARITRYVPELLRERRRYYAASGKSPALQLDELLQLRTPP